MKKYLIIALSLIGIASQAQFVANTVSMSQRNASNTQTVTTFIQAAVNTNRLIQIDGADQRLKHLDIGAGFTITTVNPSNNTLSVSIDIQNESPINAGTVSVNDTNREVTVFMNPGGTLAALTIDLPSDANSRLGQIVRLATTQALSAVTIDQAGGGGTILGNVSAFAAEDCYSFQKVASNTWIRLK